MVNDPRACDVVFGRGGNLNNRRQHSIYHALLERHWLEYSQQVGAAAHRRFVQERFIHVIKEMGGRFLRKSKKETVWEEVIDETDIVLTLMQALRDYRKRRSRRRSSESYALISERREADTDSDYARSDEGSPVMLETLNAGDTVYQKTEVPRQPYLQVSKSVEYKERPQGDLSALMSKLEPRLCELEKCIESLEWSNRELFNRLGDISDIEKADEQSERYSV
ncbi:predicted protein [Phaeodactylum tricornutum CCAP 1055/1]|jgi:uncharacterized protein (DUF1330 family)|uniref:DUF6824 domain-containing protein n=1 Tax=Phaeodactylum tricornutum (strain CCAP 1055/1) TaxID=556484 RepID=B7GCJ4_PHATC|nr:predicted protein [Phaeodactylum tricornutum CCAP 1055/1]EEC43619.1 predicted protein [Phaeodactylum tricornutum CCAP 1055/1]|eukprot:XP_002184883.1 predicted protein [Phaeodactylum tricornutum CCAP 1055/1]